MSSFKRKKKGSRSSSSISFSSSSSSNSSSSYNDNNPQQQQQQQQHTPLKFPGTKSWVNSSTLISTGNRDLDSIIGGGQALQTSILLEEDRFSDYGQTFGRYWCAEGLSNGHHLIVVDFNDLENEGEGDGDGDNFEAEEFIGSLPLDANLEKLEKKVEEQVRS